MSSSISHLDQLLGEAWGETAPAIVCRVEIEGRLVYESGWGWVDPETRKRSVDGETLFDLASLTKLFTTTALLRLVDAGTVHLDQPLSELLDEFDHPHTIGGAEDPFSKQPLPANPKWAGQSVPADGVSIRQLLTHSSGLAAWRSIYRICGKAPAFPLAKEEIDRRQACALAAAAGFPLVRPPGTGYAYSDIGMILLGFALTRAGGFKRLDEAIEELVIRPLDLKACYNPSIERIERIAPSEICSWRGRRLRGEVHDENAAGMGGIAAHAGLFGTARDVCRLGNLYLDGGDLLSSSLIAESVSEQFVSQEGDRRGLGWLLQPQNTSLSSGIGKANVDMTSFGHTGFTGTWLLCDPQRSLSCALLTNRVYYGRNPDRIRRLRFSIHRAMIEAVDGGRL